MSYTTASVSGIENRPSNRFVGPDNVIDIREDAKLKLQLKTKAMLDELKNDSDKAYFQQKYDKLLDTKEFDISKKETQPKLDDLKKEIEKKYESLPGIKKTVQEINDLIDNKLKSLEMKFSGIDSQAEFAFDNRVLANTNIYSDPNDLETAFNSDFLPSLDILLTSYENQELTETLKNYRFELRDVEEALLEGGSQFDISQKGHEFQINENITAQKGETTSYFDVTQLSKEEKKKFVDVYSRKEKDKSTALKNILDELSQTSDINNINQDAFVLILGDIVKGLDAVEKAACEACNITPTKIDPETGITAPTPEYTERFSNEKYQKAFKKAFKKNFNENFVGTKRYEKSGLKGFQRFETGKIADIFWEYKDWEVNQKESEDGKQNLVDEIQRLISASRQHVDYMAEANAEIMLRYITPVNVFEFLSDFNSDGKVDGDLNGNGDRGSMTGFQMHEMLVQYSDTQRDPNGYNMIKDGPATSKLIETILTGVVASEATNSKFKTIVEYFLRGAEIVDYTTETVDDKNGNHKEQRVPKTEKIKLEPVKDENGHYSMENFLKLMKGEYENRGWKDQMESIEDKDVKKTQKSLLTVTSAKDIKAYLIKHGQALNAQIGGETLFMKKEDFQDRILELAEDAERSDTGINKGYRNSAKKKIDGLDWDKIGEKLEKENKAERIKQMKKEGLEKVMFVLANLTSYIFLNLSSDTEAWAGMFGSSFGQLEFKNLLKDKEKNKDTIMSKVGTYLLTHMSLSFAKTPRLGESKVKGRQTISPVIGMQIRGFDKQIQAKDGSISKWSGGVNAGFLANMNALSNSGFMLGVGTEYAWQTNFEKTKDLSKLSVEGWKGLGIEAGIGVGGFFNMADMLRVGPYVGMFRERDYLLGITQKGIAYEQEMKAVFITNAPQSYTDKADFIKQSKAKIGNNNPNEKFLIEEIQIFADQLEYHDMFTFVASKDLDTQQKLWKYLKKTYIRGSKENIKEDMEGQLNGRIKLTRLGVRVDIFGLIIAGMTGGVSEVAKAAAGSMSIAQFTKYKNYREKDVKRGIENYKTISRMHGLIEDKETHETLEAMADDVRHNINGRRNYLQASADADQGTITISADPRTAEGKNNVLDHMNVYYAPDAQDKFSYDGTNLILGKVPINIYKVMNNDSIEVFMVIGDNLTGPPQQLTPSYKGIESKDVPKIEKETLKSKPVTRDELKGLTVNTPTNGDATITTELQKQYVDRVINSANDPKKLLDSQLDGLVNGRITVTKNTDNTFTFKLDKLGTAQEAKNNAITFVYEDKKITTKEGEDVYTENTILSLTDTDISKLFDINKFEKLKEARNILDSLTKKLENLERETVNNPAFVTDPTKPEKITQPRDAYLMFMTYLANVAEGDGDYIDKKELTSAIVVLEKFVGRKQFKALRDIIDAGDEITKAWILDEMKSIFARETIYFTSTVKGIGLTRNADFANAYFGPSKKQFNEYSAGLPTELLTIKNDLLTELNDTKFQDPPTEAKNIIGYTAYYRGPRSKKHQNKRYSVTGLGQTTMQGHEVDIRTNEEFARNWFLDNLKVNTYEVKLLADMIGKQVGSTLTENNVLELLNSPSEELILDDGKKKITLESSMVFYLAGSCANESIGFKIKSLKVEELKKDDNNDNQNGDEIVETILYTGVLTPGAETTGYRSGMRTSMLLQDHDISTRETSMRFAFIPGKERDAKPQAVESWGEAEDGGSSVKPSNSSGSSEIGGSSVKPPG